MTWSPGFTERRLESKALLIVKFSRRRQDLLPRVINLAAENLRLPVLSLDAPGPCQVLGGGGWRLEGNKRLWNTTNRGRLRRGVPR